MNNEIVDIEKVFLNIGIVKSDKDLLSLLLFENSFDETLRMKVLYFTRVGFE